MGGGSERRLHPASVRLQTLLPRFGCLLRHKARSLRGELSTTPGHAWPTQRSRRTPPHVHQAGAKPPKKQSKSNPKPNNPICSTTQNKTKQSAQPGKQNKNSKKKKKKKKKKREKEKSGGKKRDDSLPADPGSDSQKRPPLFGSPAGVQAAPGAHLDVVLKALPEELHGQAVVVALGGETEKERERDRKRERERERE